MDRKKILLDSVGDAKKWMKLSKDPAHDIEHVTSVTRSALQICSEIDFKDTLIIEVMCGWHDVGRLFSPIHEELSAQIARYNLLGYDCDADTVEVVYQGIRFHQWKMKPKTLEGDILRDADKLDFISVDRWKKCIKENHTEHLISIAELIPKLREILTLDASKEIYDLRMGDFIDYTKRDKGFINSKLTIKYEK